MADVNLWLIGGGLLVGILFGITVQRTQFCMVSAVSNAVIMRDFRHAHAYFAALIIGLIGTLVLELGGWVAVSETSYRVPRYDWLVIVLGGLMFGLGSMLAGGCAGRTTVRASEGNLGAMIVLLTFALTAAATYFGALEPYRVWLMQHTAVELTTPDSAIAAVAGLPHWLGPVMIAFLCLSGIMMLGNMKGNARLLTAGSVIGLLVVAGWFITGYLSVDDFSEHRASSVTIAGSLARATVFLTTGRFPGYGFTIAVLVGIVMGATSSAIVTKTFHLVIPEGNHLKHLLLGGVLMGIGAICAGGCNIGAGLTGMSTTSVRAITALLAIVAGMLLGIYLLTRTEKADTQTHHQHRRVAGA